MIKNLKIIEMTANSATFQYVTFILCVIFPPTYDPFNLWNAHI